ARQDLTRAVRFAFFLGHSMIFTGERGQAGGWFARARGLLAQRGVDCAEWGYLLIPPGVEQLFAGETEAACRTFTEALAIARRFADQDLLAMAGHCRGRALIQLGLTAEGMAVLDEAMLAVTTGMSRPCSWVTSIAASWRPARKSSMWAGRANGPQSLPGGAKARPIPCPTADLAWFTGWRSCVCAGTGRTRSRKRCAH